MKKQMRLYTYSNREQSNKLYSVYEEETVTYSNREQSNILYTVYCIVYMKRRLLPNLTAPNLMVPDDLVQSGKLFLSEGNHKEFTL